MKEIGRQVYLGGYMSEEHAAEAYDVAALKCKVGVMLRRSEILLSCIKRQRVIISFEFIYKTSMFLKCRSDWKCHTAAKNQIRSFHASLYHTGQSRAHVSRSQPVSIHTLTPAFPKAVITFQSYCTYQEVCVQTVASSGHFCNRLKVSCWSY